jgi:hypothetical protein
VVPQVMTSGGNLRTFMAKMTTAPKTTPTIKQETPRSSPCLKFEDFFSTRVLLS